MTVPAPDIRLSSEFPTNADRTAGVFNPKAAEWANTSRDMAADMDAAAKATQINADETATNASNSAVNASTASNAATRAEAARDRAVQAEQAIDQALADGPVLSVDGQNGVVELHLNARMQAAALSF